MYTRVVIVVHRCFKPHHVPGIQLLRRGTVAEHRGDAWRDEGEDVPRKGIQASKCLPLGVQLNQTDASVEEQ
jgi:hypothetical protein